MKRLTRTINRIPLYYQVVLTVAIMLLVGGMVYVTGAGPSGWRTEAAADACLLRDGSLAMSGPLKLNGNGVTNDTTAANAANVTRSSTLVVCASDALDPGQCDYLTDGTADDVQIQAALDALPSGKGTVQLIGTTFNIAAGLVMDTAYEGLRGERNSTLVLGAGVTGPVITVSGNDFLIDTITIDLSGENETGISVNGSTGGDIIGAYVYDTAAVAGAIGINVTGASNDIRVDRYTCRYIDTCYLLDTGDQLGFWLTNSLFAGWGSYAIRLGPGSGTPRRIFLTNDMVPGSGDNGTGPFLSLDKVGTVFITGGEWQTNSSATGTVEINMQNGSVTWVQVANVEWINSDGPVVYINRASTYTLGYLDIVNAHIASLTDHDIEVTDGAAIAQMLHCLHCSFTENKTPSNTFDHINVATGSAPIKIEASELFGQSNTVRYGVSTPASNQIQLLDNFISPSGTWGTAPWDNPPAVVRNNKNWLTKNRGTGTITGTSLVVTHGLAITPAAGDCSVTLSENPTDAVGSVWIDTFTATQFTVNVESDPGTSDLDFAWYCDVEE